MPDRNMTAFPTNPIYVSCAPHILYGETMPADVAMEADPRAYGIELVDQVFAGMRYDWQFPPDGFVVVDDFTRDLQDFYQRMAIKRCPPSLLVGIQRATLFKTVIHCSGPAGPAILYETYRPGDRTPDAMPSRRQWSEADRLRFSGRNWYNLFIGSIGTPNYGHWMIDDLPRIKAAAILLRRKDRPLRIIAHGYNDNIDRVRLESIRSLIGFDVEVEFTDFNNAYYFDNIYYVTPVSEHPVKKSPIAISYVTRKLHERVADNGGSAKGGDRLFVTRTASRGRILFNQDAVIDIVKRSGFTVVETEGMSFEEQVRLFSNASAIIGQMGAAMTNTMFCPPATRILYLAPWGWIEPFYWDLSVVCGHKYRILYGAVKDHGIPAQERSFYIDPNILSIVMGEFE